MWSPNHWTAREFLSIADLLILAISMGMTLEEGMETHSSILAWRILWPEESGSLQSIRLQRVGHDRSF